MTPKMIRNAGLTSITALSLALVACGGSSSSAPPAPANEAPQVTRIDTAGVSSFVTGHTYYLQAYATDKENDTVTFSAGPGSTADATVDAATGKITFTPKTAGPAALSIVATDSKTNKSVAYPLTLVVKANSAPQFGSVSASRSYLTTAAKDVFTVSATDADLDEVTIAPDGTWPAWATYANGMVSIDVPNVPAADRAKVNTFTLKASDKFGGSTPLVFSVVVNEPTNGAPSMTGYQGQKPAYYTGHTYTLFAIATDPEQDTLEYELETNPAATLVNKATGEISFKPTQATTQQIRVRAKDVKGHYSQWLPLTISVDANRAPQFGAALQNTLNLTQTVGSRLFSMTVTATDPDGDAVTLTQDGTWPQWAKLNNGALEIDLPNVPAGDLGTEKAITIKASDITGASNNFTITVNVKGAPFNVTRLAVPQVVIAGRTYPIGTTDLNENRFTAYSDAKVLPTEKLTWKLLYSGTGTNGTMQTKDGALGANSVEFDPITIPLADKGSKVFFTVEVSDGKGNVVRGDRYEVSPIANTNPVLASATLVDANFLRDLDGTNPAGDPATGIVCVVNYDKPVPTSATGLPIHINVKATDVNSDPVTFATVTAIDNATLATTKTALKGAVKIDRVDNNTAQITYTPTKDDVGKQPAFLVTFADWSATDQTGEVHAASVAGTAAAANIVAGTAGSDRFVVVRKNLPTQVGGLFATDAFGTAFTAGAANLAATNTADPRGIANEEGTATYGVKFGSLDFAALGTAPAGINVLIRDLQDTTLDAIGSADYLWALYTGGPQLGGSAAKITTDVALYGGSLTQNFDGVINPDNLPSANDKKAIYSINWIPAHQDVRKPVTFTATVKDVWGVNSNAYSWVTQSSALVTQAKTDTVYFNAGTAATQAKAWPKGDVLTYQPYNRRALNDAAMLGNATFAPFTAWGIGLKGEQEGITSEFGTTNWAGLATTLDGRLSSGTGLVFPANAGAVATGNYMITFPVSAVGKGIYAMDMNDKQPVANVTDDLDLSKVFVGRDWTRTVAKGNPGGGTGFTVTNLQGLTPWTDYSVLQFHNDNVADAGNIVLQHGQDTAARFARVAATAPLTFPFAGITNGNNYLGNGVAINQAGTRFISGPVAPFVTTADGASPSSGTSTAMKVWGLGGATGLSLAAPTAAGSLFDNTTAGAKDNLWAIQLSPKVVGDAIVTRATRMVKPLVDMTSTDLAHTADFAPSLLNASNGPTDEFQTGGNSGLTVTKKSWKLAAERAAFYSLLQTVGGTNGAATPTSWIQSSFTTTAAAPSASVAMNEQFAVYAAPKALARGFEKQSPMVLLAQNFYANSTVPASFDITTAGTLNLGDVDYITALPAQTYTEVAQYAVQARVTMNATAQVAASAPFTGAASPVVGADYGTIANIVTYSTDRTATIAPKMAPVSGLTLSFTTTADVTANPQTIHTVDLANSAKVLSGTGAPATGALAAPLSLLGTLTAAHKVDTTSAQVVGLPAGTQNATAAVRLTWTVPADYTANYSGAEVEVWGYDAAGANTFATAGTNIASLAAGSNTAPTKLFTVITGGKDVRIPVSQLAPGAGADRVAIFFRVRSFNVKKTDGTLVNFATNPFPFGKAGISPDYGYAEFVSQPVVVAQ